MTHSPALQKVPPTVVSLADHEHHARLTLDDAVWAYFNGGAADGITLRANALAWQGVSLLPRVMRPLAGGHTRVPLLGRERLGMLAHYCGDPKMAEDMLSRAVRLGLDSKMFDAQALLLLAFARLDNNDLRGLARTVDQLTRLRDRSHAPARPHRLLGMAESLLALQNQNTARALDEVRRLANDALSPDFDFETACNLLALMGRLHIRSIALNESEAAVDTLASHFGSWQTPWGEQPFRLPVHAEFSVANVAAALGVSADSFLMAVAIGASCAFLTPIGHQNNTLILGPGGFRFGDYWRLGLPLEILVTKHRTAL